VDAVDAVDAVDETGIVMDSLRLSTSTTSMRQAAPESLATSAATSPETRTI